MQLKLIGIALAALAIVGLIAHDHYVTKRLNAEKRANVALTQKLENAEKLRQIALDDKRNADDTSQRLQARLSAIRDEPRITGVRICRAPAAAVPAESGGSSGSQGAVTGRVEEPPEEDSIDVSDAVDRYATDCAAVAEIARGWQEWDAGRTH